MPCRGSGQRSPG